MSHACDNFQLTNHTIAMSHLLNNLLNEVNGTATRQLGLHLNTSEEETQQALGSALPLLLQSLAKKTREDNPDLIRNQVNAQQQGALNLRDLSDLIKGNGQTDLVQILLGNKRNRAEEYISKDSGMSRSKVSQLLAMAAPLVLQYLAKRKQEQNADPVDELHEFESEFGQQHPKSRNVFERLLDQDNDGDITDDLMNIGKTMFRSFVK